MKDIFFNLVTYGKYGNFELGLFIGGLIVHGGTELISLMSSGTFFSVKHAMKHTYL